MRYRPIELNEVFDLYKLRKTVEFHITKKKSKLRFDKFCDMLKSAGYTIL